MSCKGFVSCIDKYASMLDICVYVVCEGREGSIKIPNAILSTIEEVQEYKINVIPLIGGPVKVKMDLKNNVFEIKSNTQYTTFVILYLAYTKKYFYPLIFDTNVIKSYNNLFRLFNVKALTKVKDLNGYLLLYSRKQREFELFNLKFMKNLLKDTFVDCVDIAGYPPLTMAKGKDSEVKLFRYPHTILGEIRLKGRVKECLLFTYAGLLALLNDDNRIYVYIKIGEELKKKIEIKPSNTVRDLRWALLGGVLNLVVDLPDRLEAYTLKGDLTSIRIGTHTRAQISPLGNKIAIAYKDRIVIMDTATSEITFQRNLEGIRVMEWSPYGDYLALCNEKACYIYSDLTESIVIGRICKKPVNALSWSPRTLSLYMATQESLSVWFFDPYLVTSKNLVTRLSIFE